MVYDFHTHSFYSDGVLSPIELIRRAHTAGYKAIAVTDHAGMSNLETIIRDVAKDCKIAEEYWGIKAIPGVELTHIPAGYVAECARQAKILGARIVVVHGETITEPVEHGTNYAAVTSADVDILAHPGFLTEEEARLAAKNNVFLEVTSRGGHSLTNAHVVNMALMAGAKLLVNSDSHAPGDLLNSGFARKVALGAGISGELADSVLVSNPELLLQRIYKTC